ncbi:hypothetical protein [Brachymonas wangyanguii]|uniref:hypothetical protein n=1 Tax=Brachymonas wangyanguii TaxID=3130163 RepID=UPI00307D3A22
MRHPEPTKGEAPTVAPVEASMNNPLNTNFKESSVAHSILDDHNGQSIRVPKATKKPAPEAIPLDGCYVDNWRFGARAAILDPEADTHVKFAWLYAQVTEINELLWGYISIAENATGEKAPEMAHHLCHFIENRTTAMKRMLEQVCEETQYSRKGGAA